MRRGHPFSSLSLVLAQFLATMACHGQDPVFTPIPNPVLENGSFVDFPALKDMRSAWGDFDGDGDLDVVIMGTGPSGPVTQLYRKRPGSMSFEEVTVVPPLPQLQDGALAWGDLDGDGDLDLAISGATSSNPTGPGQLLLRVLRNNGPNAQGAWQFVNSADSPLLIPGRCGCLSWGDVDNDGDLDLFQSGIAWSPSAGQVAVPFSTILINDGQYLQATGNPFLLNAITPLFSHDFPNGFGLSKPLEGGVDNLVGGFETRRVVWTDVDRDGFVDLILTVTRPTEVTGAQLYSEEVWLNWRQRLWERVVPASGPPALVALANDLKADLEAGLFARSGVALRVLQFHPGQLQTWRTAHDHAESLLGTSGISGGAGDWNGDGKVDLAMPESVVFFDGPETTPGSAFARVLRRATGAALPDDIVPGFDLLISNVGSIHDIAGAATASADVLNQGNQQLLVAGFRTLDDILYHPPSVSLLVGDETLGLELDERLNPGINGRFRGVLDAVDVNTDGGLQVLHSGFDTADQLGTQFYTRNRPANREPGQPWNLAATATPTRVRFSWNPPTDQETRPEALRYALWLQHEGGRYFIRADVSDELNGRRLLPGLDRTITGTSFEFRPEHALPDGTYFWRVQAVDSGGRGGAFCSLQSFTIESGPPAPSSQTDGLPYRDTSLDLGDWNNDGRLDAVLAGHSETVFYPYPDKTVLSSNQDGDHFTSFLDLPPLKMGTLRWADVDGDGRLDLAIAGRHFDAPLTQVFRNTGVKLELSQELDGVEASAMDWADYDNDGDLDLVVTGYRDGVPVTQFYRNGGIDNRQPGLRPDSDVAMLDPGNPVHAIPVIGVGAGAVAWGDFDGDGDLDLLIAGDEGNRGGTSPNCTLPPGGAQPGTYYYCGAGGAPPIHPVTRLLRNDGWNASYGKWLFVPVAIDLPPLFSIYRGSGGSAIARAEWCDIDADGRPDLVLGGMMGMSQGQARLGVQVWRNAGPGFPNWRFDASAELLDNSLARSLQTLTGADWDNDGWPDLLISGGENGVGSVPLHVLVNNRMTFKTRRWLKSFGGGAEQFAGGLAAFGHFDGNGNVDVLFSGRWGIKSTGGLGAAGTVAHLFHQPQDKTNASPAPPTGLVAVQNGSEITLSWQASTDDHTPQAGISYNLSVTRADGQAGGMPGMADPTTGVRRVARIGNVGYRTSWKLRDLPVGTWKWSVQAIDSALLPSGFTVASQTFTTPPSQPPVAHPPAPWRDWIAANPQPAAVDLLSVAAGNQARIAVGRRGRILLSVRGGTFTGVHSSVAADLLDAAIADVGAIAVGEAGTIVTSNDGILWNPVSSGTTARLRAVAHGAASWLAAGDGVAVWSTDGVAWNTVALPADTIVHDLAWAFSRFVAAGERNGAGVILTSVNGSVWTDVTPPGSTDGGFFGVATDGTKAVVTGGRNVFPTRSDSAASTDGVTWTPASVANREPFLRVTASGGTWFAAGDANLYKSADGLNWQPNGPFVFNTPHYGSLAAADGVVTAVAAIGSIFDSPTDNVVWNRRGGSALITYGELRDVAVDGDTLVAVSDYPPHYVSKDGGRSWQSLGYSGGGARGLAFGAGRFVRTDPSGIDSSTDGLQWRTTRLDASQTPLFDAGSVAFGNGLFVATRGGGGFYSSPDGIVWSTVARAMPIQLSLVFGNASFVTLDSAGNVQTSVDGLTWTQRSQVAAGRLNFSNGRLFAFAATGMLTSTDAQTWLPVPGLPPGASFRQVVWHYDRWFAVGAPDALLLESTDLATWSPIPIPATGPLLAAASTGKGLVVAGTGQALLLALDPATAPPGPPVTLEIAGNPSPGVFHLRLSGPPGLVVTLEASSDLLHWGTAATATLAGGVQTLTRQAADPNRPEFFRLRWQP